MGGIKTAMITICCGSLVCGLVRLIIPSGSMSKVMRNIMALFLTACMVLPIVKVNIADINIDFEQSFDENSRLAETSRAQAENIINNNVKKILSQNGCVALSIDFLSVDEQSQSFGISGIKIVLSKRGDITCEELSSEITRQTGIPTEVSE